MISVSKETISYCEKCGLAFDFNFPKDEWNEIFDSHKRMCNGFFRTDIFDFPEKEINDISSVSDNLFKASVRKWTEDYLNQKYGE